MMNGNNSPVRKESSKSSYKFWVLFAALGLAFWSMVTGTVTLKWSVVGSLYGVSDDFKYPNFDDLDILEVEERERVVRHMWDLYGQSKSEKLPRFWIEAFEAGYENLVSEVPAIRDMAFSEIAKLSIFSVAVDPLPLKTQPPQGSKDQPRKMAKHIENKKEAIKIKPSKKEKKEVKEKAKASKMSSDELKSDS